MGRINDFKSSVPPDTVIQPNLTPKNLKNISPNQKLGIDIPIKVKILIR